MIPADVPGIEALDRLAGSWAGLAWAVLWQSTLLVGAFTLVSRALRRSSPGLRYWLWQVAAVKLLLMPIWSVSVSLPATAAGDDGPGPARGAIDRPGRSFEGPTTGPAPFPISVEEGDQAPIDSARGWPRLGEVGWRTWLMLGWGLAVAFQGSRIVRQRRRLDLLLGRARLADDPGLVALAARLSDRVGLRRPPRVLVVDGIDSPFVCGLARPTLVMPDGLPELLDPGALRSVLLHELAHLRRRDLLWDWIPTLARVLFPMLPAALVVSARIRLERELACDQVAMVLGGQDAAGYASTLVAVVGRSSAPPAPRSSARAPIDVPTIP
ncbi:M56 family metallopeptidase [Tautonia plasticadhaerens]|uniref:Regulatory protein BlaR1 n=1 Tax=Tautonia plasticadhaerens TaxID=2527974 RepID=A0A518H2K1_9BACT|nr:M56 family metallopeptidase [Tautonia plasticadhaerens]QDV35050.1 Regulatory protein BlaR1 [Tautonia plasticadhaerens]